MAFQLLCYATRPTSCPFPYTVAILVRIKERRDDILASPCKGLAAQRTLRTVVLHNPPIDY